MSVELVPEFKKDIFYIVKTNDKEKIKNCYDEYLDFAKQLLVEEKQNELQSLLFNQQNKLAELIIEQEYKGSSEYFCGKLFGMMDVLKMCLSVYFSEQTSEEAIFDNELKVIPHINEIVFNIANHEGINHTELANVSNLEKNNLTAIAKRLSDYDIITSTKQGKFKYYYLTRFGKKYYEKYLKKQKSEEYIDSLIESLIVSVRSQENSAYILQKFVNLLIKEGYNKNNQKANSNYLYYKSDKSFFNNIYKECNKDIYSLKDTKIANNDYLVNYKY